MLVNVKDMNGFFRNEKSDFSDICLEIVSSYCERCTKKKKSVKNTKKERARRGHHSPLLFLFTFLYKCRSMIFRQNVW